MSVLIKETKNAIIKSTSITTDQGTLSVWLHLDYGGAGQAFGGYSLHRIGSFRKSIAGHFITRCMEMAGADTFCQLPGKTVRVHIGQTGSIIALGHILLDAWFWPSKEFEKIMAETLK